MYDIYNMNISSWQPENAIAVMSDIAAYICPSVPDGDRKINYTVPPEFTYEGMQLAPPNTLVDGGVCDYIVLSGVRSGFLDKARSEGWVYADRGGWAGYDVTVLSDLPIFQEMTSVGGYTGPIAEWTDGTSNTMMICELAGRNTLYRVGMKVDDNDPEAEMLAIAGGGAWSDFTNGENWLTGRLYDGTEGTGEGGPCIINCNNSPGNIYGFHPGGVQVLFGDGSVQFIFEGVNAASIASMVTPQGADISSQY